MPIDGLNSNSGADTGEAAIFQPYKSNVGEELAKIRGQQRAVKQKREEDIYSDLGKINASGIFFKHQQDFADKQKAIYDYVKQNVDDLRKGDPNKTIEFRQMLTKLGTDIGESKGVAESYKEAGKDYIANPDKYEPETRDAFTKFEGIDRTTGQFENFDPSQMQQRVDVQKEFRTNYAPQLQHQLDTEISYVRNPATGVIESKIATDLPREKLDDVATEMAQNPILVNKAVRELKKKGETIVPDVYKTDANGKEVKDANGRPVIEKYGSVHNYLFDATNLKNYERHEIAKKSTSGWNPNSGGGGKGVLTLSDISQLPINIKDATTGKDVRDNQTGVTLPSDFNLNIPNDQSIALATTGRAIQIEDESGKQVPYTGQLDITGGGTVRIGRVYNAGTKKSVYVPQLYAKATNSDGDKLDVIVPLSTIRGQKEIEKQKVVMDELQRRADEMNNPKAKESKSALPKKGDKKTLSSGKVATFDGKQWKL